MPSPRASKDKGRKWENEIVTFLNDMIEGETERRRLAGAQDKGDIAGIKNLVIEAKNEKKYQIPQWMREAQVEARNADAILGVVWMRLMGKPKAADGVILMSPLDFLFLLDRAGFVNLAPPEDVQVSSSDAE